jgi:hypothetical protein
MSGSALLRPSEMLVRVCNELRCGDPDCPRPVVSAPPLLACGHILCLSCVKTRHLNEVKAGIERVAQVKKLYFICFSRKKNNLIFSQWGRYINQGAQRNFVSLSRGIVGLPFHCPVCNVATAVDAELEDFGLKKHISLSNMVNTVRAPVVPSSVCDLCLAQRAGLALCGVCSLVFCEECGASKAHSHPRQGVSSGLFLIKPKPSSGSAGKGKVVVVAHLPDGTAFPCSLSLAQAEARAMADSRGLEKWCSASGLASRQVAGVVLEARACRVLVQRVRISARFSASHGTHRSQNIKFHETFLVRRCNTDALPVRLREMLEGELFNMIMPGDPAGARERAPSQQQPQQQQQSQQQADKDGDEGKRRRHRFRLPSQNSDDDEVSGEMAGCLFVHHEDGSSGLAILPAMTQQFAAGFSGEQLGSKIRHRYAKDHGMSRDEESLITISAVEVRRTVIKRSIEIIVPLYVGYVALSERPEGLPDDDSFHVAVHGITGKVGWSPIVARAPAADSKPEADGDVFERERDRGRRRRQPREPEGAMRAPRAWHEWMVVFGLVLGVVAMLPLPSNARVFLSIASVILATWARSVAAARGPPREREERGGEEEVAGRRRRRRGD